MSDKSPEDPPRTGKRRSLLPWLLSACVLAALAGATFWARDKTPPLDAPTLEARREAWALSPVRDYDLSVLVEVDSREPERYEIRVREDRLESETLEGRRVRRGMVGSPYSVPGLFATLARELEQARESSTGRTLLKARFHPQWNLPTVFRRISTDASRRSVVITVERMTTPDGRTLVGEPTADPS